MRFLREAASDKSYSYQKSHSFLDRDREVRLMIGSPFHPSMSVNNHTFRGDYKDANNMFKAICSAMVKRPKECSQINYFESKPVIDIDRKNFDWRDPDFQKRVQTEILRNKAEFEAEQAGMDRNATISEIVLGLVVAVIILGGCFAYCKLYNKRKQDQVMQVAVNEQVAQYFQLARDDPTERASRA